MPATAKLGLLVNGVLPTWPAFEYEKFQKGRNTVLTLEAIGSIRCSPETPPWWVLHRCRGRARRVVPAGHGWSGTVRRSAGPARVEDLGEAATTRGKWRRGRGGDGERDAARRGRRRRPEGGGDEGEATATGDLGDAARVWRFGGAGDGPG